MEMLSRHFTLDEMLVSQTAARMGINMTPPPAVKISLTALCQSVLDPIRDAIKAPIHVSSGYRPPQLNRIIHGAVSSQHCLGEAADINVPGYTPAELAKFILKLGVPFDQMILEFGQWVHVSHKPFGFQRGNLLTARLIAGHAHYLTGLV